MLGLTQLSNYLLVTSEGSFSSVSTATVVRKHAFCSIFYLQDLHHKDQGSRIKDQWSFENALDLENEVSSAPTQEQIKVYSRVCMRGNGKFIWMKISLSFSFLVIISLSLSPPHKIYCSTAGREFKNPNKLDMRPMSCYVCPKINTLFWWKEPGFQQFLRKKKKGEKKKKSKSPRFWNFLRCRLWTVCGLCCCAVGESTGMWLPRHLGAPSRQRLNVGLARCRECKRPHGAHGGPMGPNWANFPPLGIFFSEKAPKNLECPLVGQKTKLFAPKFCTCWYPNRLVGTFIWPFPGFQYFCQNLGSWFNSSCVLFSSFFLGGRKAFSAA